MIDLSLIWIVIIAIGVFIYVVLDGFDLGIGILFPFIKDQQERDVMMNTVAPVWDGNETWMVLGGAGLFAAFPMVYSAVLSALYLPIILMVIALIFRGVAFEFRFKANRTKYLWDAAFIGGSVLSSFLQGVILGAYIQGIHVIEGRYAGGGLDWLTPFSVFTGFGVIIVYAALGCGWLITNGPPIAAPTPRSFCSGVSPNTTAIKVTALSGSAVPKAASTEPTAVAPRLRRLPNHSIPLTKYSQAR